MAETTIVVAPLDEGDDSLQEAPGATERMVKILEGQGYDVRLVASGEQASYVDGANLRAIATMQGRTLWIESEHALTDEHAPECADAICADVQSAYLQASADAAEALDQVDGYRSMVIIIDGSPSERQPIDAIAVDIVLADDLHEHLGAGELTEDADTSGTGWTDLPDAFWATETGQVYGLYRA